MIEITFVKQADVFIWDDHNGRGMESGHIGSYPEGAKIYPISLSDNFLDHSQFITNFDMGDYKVFIHVPKQAVIVRDLDEVEV